MKNLKIFGVAFLSILSYNCASSQTSTATNKPNIILIVADDLGWKDVGFMGSKFYETPNLDALAKQSLLFTNAYTAAANCAPSRACLFTGMNTPRHGIYTVGTSERGDEASRKLIPIKNTDILADNFFTLSEALQQAGYYTANIGKWHIGEDPKTQGFDFNVGGTHQGNPPSYFAPYRIPAIKDGPDGEYLTDRLTTEAVSFLKENSKKQFFLYLPYYAVHTPLQVPQVLKEKYEKKLKTPGQKHATYAGMIESLDTNIGRILHQLDELNLSKNTIVIFTSDNGGIRNISHQDPLRAGKGSYYEGGIRVPLIIRWPGKVTKGSKTDVPVTNLDFYPTILDILSIKPVNAKLDGISFLPVLKGGTLAERPLYWHFPIYLQAYDSDSDDGRDPVFRTRPGAAVRLGDWKLHEYYEDDAIELYNLKDDVSERNNLASKNSAMVKKLHDKLINWQKEVNAPIPTKPNPNFNPALQFTINKVKRGSK
ncbi:MAG: sulfatase [Chitinophagaceae bacterium]